MPQAGVGAGAAAGLGAASEVLFQLSNSGINSGECIAANRSNMQLVMSSNGESTAGVLQRAAMPQWVLAAHRHRETEREGDGEADRHTHDRELKREHCKSQLIIL